jgi:SAM-dependent methyltransferase
MSETVVTGLADDVVAEWIEPHLPTMFSTWHSYLIRAERATIEAVIEEARVEPGYHVLDVGCGSGIPTLDLAEVVGPTGKVVATDPSPDFIAAVTKNVRELGLTNVEIVQTSAASLPFPEASFDAATCHFGAMFFPDMTAGLSRIRSVLRSGARASFVGWGPPETNTLFGSFWSAAGPYLPESPAPPPPDAPTPTRFALPGTLTNALRAAGFKDVREETRIVELIWPGNAETSRDWWMGLTGIAQQIAPERLQALETDLLASFNRYADGDTLRFTAPVVIGSGQARS